MAIQFSTTVRNAMLQAVKDTLGTGAKILVYSFTQPANCAAAATGTLLGRITASSNFGTPSGGVMSGLAGTSFPGLDDLDAGHFRIFDSTETTCHIQGSISTAGNGGDMTVDSLAIYSGSKGSPGTEVTVNSFSITENNA